MNTTLNINIGVKTDPIEYRYSYPWLFNLLAEEGIRHVQIGTFFELYQLPDDFFEALRSEAHAFGISITSMFTAHRELGGFFREETGWSGVARRNYERFIEVGALLGARSVGSNPGAILRDRMEFKAEGIRNYLHHMEALMHYAYEKGVDCLTMEPMSCIAEPPTLPGEIISMAEHLAAYHAANSTTARIGYCADVSHGYVNTENQVVHDHFELLRYTLPWLEELHLKNTDTVYGATFGFSQDERAHGIIDLCEVREFLLAHAGMLPNREVTAYLEIGGPKTGRDYSDPLLEKALRESLRHIKEVFQETDGHAPCTAPVNNEITGAGTGRGPVEIAPSLMCADLCHLESSVRDLERLGVDWLHLDIMDAQFTPNMPIGLEMLRQLRPKTTLPFDAHLMVMDNDFFVRELSRIGVQQISVHVESCRHLDKTLASIQEAGIRAGAALNPATPLSALDYILERLDFILIMTVNPGFAGQQIVPSGLRKIDECRRYLDARGLAIPIQVDGHVSFSHIPEMVAAGADCLVAGTSSMYHPGASLRENRDQMNAAIRDGLAHRDAPETRRPC